MKIQYKDASNKEKAELSNKAAKIRSSIGLYDEKNNPKGYTVKSSLGLDYYTIIDVTKKLNGLMLQYEYLYSERTNDNFVRNLEDFYNIVKNKAELDLKNQPDWQHSHFIYSGEVVDKDVPGNISYGYFGKVMNIPDRLLTAGAGFAQIKAGTFSINGLNFTSFGDDPRDTQRILQGIKIYYKWHK
ncbi:hypothetical protein JJQ72_20040 [Paenibacillus sp. F411]|uniref:polymorphic toxin type 44 domain-containing protein n=1 Tax=Paenibacillus sp. F411 TaxID=2820239 RepID=UPI001AAEF50E|nr:polymorphic toxin type 44 domain-containing protein [Paenibacillus sp. F411]MBO2946249.1 hypothetical protein [Paenibacillus sp. F411]